MRILDLGPRVAERITNFDSKGATSVPIAHGSGESHFYVLRFEPGGRIGRHPAGPAQLLLAVEGSGWVEGGDGVRMALRRGEAACFEAGEMHAKGSEVGMTAIMVQQAAFETVAGELMRADERPSGGESEAAVREPHAQEEPIEIAPYQPAWGARFDVLRRLLHEALGPLAIRIEHVGSTAVPGLEAKPIIDVDVVIADGSDFAAVRDRLMELGYAHRGQRGVPGREAFEAEWTAAGLADHHLYVCRESAEELRRHLAFRDALVRDPDLAASYGRLKRVLARRFRHDREGYTDAKSGFIERTLAWSPSVPVDPRPRDGGTSDA
jgi:GrpB-like predicted nucleotidyltransferase (UPF0157 family)/quercetin dioxygenase-like cupin family protein